MFGVLGTGSWALFFYFVLLLRHAAGRETNRTIDDRFGDSVTGQKPIFLPTSPGIWDGETCTGCRFQPDKAVAFKGTWQAATFRPEVGGSGPLSIDLSFKGTAIYVFFITGNQIAGGIITTLMECNFTLDGLHAGFFQHIPDKSQDFQYNVLAFSKTGLPNVDHTVRVTTEGVNYHLLLNFDYAIYTFDDTPDPTTVQSTPSTTLSPPETTTPSGAPALNTDSESERKPPLGAIVGGTLGGLAVILGLIVLLYIYRDKKVRRKSPGLPLHTQDITPSTGEVPRDVRSFTRTLLTKSSKNYDRKSLLQSINAPGIRTEPPSSEHSSSPDNTAIGSDSILTNPYPSSTSSDAARRARRAQLESQLRAAEQELREMGVDPRRGPPDPNTSPAMLQTSVYIEYRRLQGEMEEPPPQYSE